MDLLRESKRITYEVATAMIEYEIEDPDAEVGPDENLSKHEGQEGNTEGHEDDKAGPDGGEDSPLRENPAVEEGHQGNRSGLGSGSP